MGWARYAHSMRVFVLNSGLFYIRWVACIRWVVVCTSGGWLCTSGWLCIHQVGGLCIR